MRTLWAGPLGRTALALAFAIAVSSSSEAAFPGANGKLAFASNPAGTFDVFTVEPDGSGLLNLTSHAAEDVDPVWSPDGTRIAFVSDRDGLPAVYVMNADGTGVVRITDGPDRFPAWSPDGLRIAFSRFGEDTFDFDIWVANADGSAPVNLTNSARDDVEPSWSPDGTKIAFTSYRTGDGEVFVMGADGSAPTNRTASPGEDRSPDWSPDGTRIVFSSLRGGTSGIWVMNADGSGQAALSTLGDIGPAWSPDGTRIVFSSDRDRNLEIYVMNADGSDPLRLTADDPETLRDDVLADWQPVAPGGENRPPVAVARGPEGAIECASASGGVARLDGSASSDPDSTPGTNDDIVLFEWFEDLGLPSEKRLGEGETIEAELPLGLHAITLRVTDRGGLADTDEIELAVVDTVPPEVSLSLTPSVLWPPDHRMVAVHATVEVADACGVGSVRLGSVTSSEPDDAPGMGDGHTAPDIAGAEVGTPDRDVELRAERGRYGPGRTYTLAYTAADAAGNLAVATGIVRVPHDRGAPGEPLPRTGAAGPDRARRGR